MGHFPTHENNIYFHLVTIFEEAKSVSHLELQVMIFNLRSEFYLLDLYYFLMNLGSMLPFALLVFELSVVHQPADRWICLWRNFN